MNLTTILTVASLIFSIVSFFPLLPFQHWVFRVFDFIRIQLLGILIFLSLIWFFTDDGTSLIELISRSLLLISIIYQTLIIAPYLPIKKNDRNTSIKSISLLNVNVMQDNDNYSALTDLIKKVDPDVLLTMESNKDWENALSETEQLFVYSWKVPLENRYGMHLYSKLDVLDCKTHQLISEEFPSIEATMKDHSGQEFIFWGLHPPPPSPTEKPTSRQKDAELMIAGKLIRENKLPTIVSGDFNNVCWSRSSKLFAKMTGLIDARLGRGLYGTFPVKPKFFRFPIDLIFHSKSIEIHQLRTLEDIGSDHLPLLTKLSIPGNAKKRNAPMESDTKEEVNTIIEEGKEAADEENDN